MTVNPGGSRFLKFVRSPAFVPLALLLVDFLLFGKCIRLHDLVFMSSSTGAIAKSFNYWREFGFNAMAHGHVPLWNPHVFSGTPFAANWLSALFYPLNWLYLLRWPLETRINLDLAIHVWLTGLFTSIWASRYTKSPFPRFFAGIVAMLGWPFYLHVYAGDLTTIDAMAWSPLILFAADRLVSTPNRRWTALAGFAAGMQILAGHTPTVICTGIAAALYIALRLRKAKKPLLTLSYTGAALVLALGISAVQLSLSLPFGSEQSHTMITGFGMTSGAGPTLDSIPTLFVPTLFGDLTHQVYWGRMELWDTSLFIGVGALSLAVIAVIRRRSDRARTWLIMVIALLVLAFGVHSPLGAVGTFLFPKAFPIAYFAPFAYLMGLFLALLSAVGLHDILVSETPAKPVGIASIALAALLTFAGLWLSSSPVINSDFGIIEPVFVHVQASGKVHLPPETFADPVFAEHVRRFTSTQLFVAAGILAALGFLYLNVHLFRAASWAIGILSVLELIMLASRVTATTPLHLIRPDFMGGFADEHPGDYRILQGAYSPESAAVQNLDDLWGYDPYVLKRYRDLIAASLNLGPDFVGDTFNFNHLSPFYTMLRCQFYFQPSNGKLGILAGTPGYPHAMLVNDAHVVASAAAALQAVSARNFNPATEVVLESTPVPNPIPTAAGASVDGTVLVSGDEGDSLTIEATTSAPAIILLTDAYEPGWQAVALPGSTQNRYDVLSADYAVMGIPIAAGEHHIRLTYRSSAFERGRWVSLISVAVLGFLALPLGTSSKEKSTASHESTPQK